MSSGLIRLARRLIEYHGFIELHQQELLHDLVTVFRVYKTDTTISISPQRLIPVAICCVGQQHWWLLIIIVAFSAICMVGRTDLLRHAVFKLVLDEVASLAILNQKTVKVFKLFWSAQRPTDITDKKLHEHVEDCDQGLRSHVCLRIFDVGNNACDRCNWLEDEQSWVNHKRSLV